MVGGSTSHCPHWPMWAERSKPPAGCCLGLRLCRGWSRQPLPYFPQHFFLHFFFCVPCPHHVNQLLLSSPGWARGPSLLPRTAVPRISVLSPENRVLPHPLLRHQSSTETQSPTLQPDTQKWVFNGVREGLWGRRGRDRGLCPVSPPCHPSSPSGPLCLVPWDTG